jgi:hypothetical protein
MKPGLAGALERDRWSPSPSALVAQALPALPPAGGDEGDG